MSALPAASARGTGGLVLPQKPDVLRSGIFLAWTHIVVVLAAEIYGMLAPNGLVTLYGDVAMLTLQAIFLGGLYSGGSKMRWLYIGFDALLTVFAVLAVLQTGQIETKSVLLWALSAATWICLCMPASNAWFAQARALRLRWRGEASAEYAAWHKVRALRLLAGTLIGVIGYVRLAFPLNLSLAVVLVTAGPLLITGLWVAAWHAWQGRRPARA